MGSGSSIGIWVTGDWWAVAALVGNRVRQRTRDSRHKAGNTPIPRREHGGKIEHDRHNPRDLGARNGSKADWVSI
jgi:hypothetical protein